MTNHLHFVLKGGSFGYARCTISPFVGYLVGFFDLLQNLTYMTVFASAVAASLMIATNSPDRFEPLWWLLTLSVLLGLSGPGGKFFWRAMWIGTFITVSFLLVYCLGNLGHVNFSKHAFSSVSGFVGDGKMFFLQISVPMWNYLGVDLIVPFSEEMKQV